MLDLTFNRVVVIRCLQYGYAVPEGFKFGEPEDIASLVSYLASKEAHYVTELSDQLVASTFSKQIKKAAFQVDPPRTGAARPPRN